MKNWERVIKAIDGALMLMDSAQEDIPHNDMRTQVPAADVAGMLCAVYGELTRARAKSLAAYERIEKVELGGK